MPGQKSADKFPIHCGYGTRDGEVAVDVSRLPDIRYLVKNRFSTGDGTGARPSCQS